MKTTKQLLLASFILALSAGNSSAQSFYAGIGGGYGFAAAKMTLDNSLESINYTTGLSYKGRAISTSFGKGVNTGIFIGYKFSNYVSAEINASYLICSKVKYSKSVVDNINNNTTITDYTFFGRSIRLIPTIRIQAGDNNVHPYIKAGFIVGLGTKVIEEEHITRSGNITSDELQTTKFSGGVNIGFHGALGVLVMINTKVGIYAEAAAFYTNWSPNRSDVIKYNVDGTDKLSQLSVYNKESVYYADISYNNTTTTPQSNYAYPHQKYKFFFPFSSIGINVGIHVAFGRNPQAAVILK